MKLKVLFLLAIVSLLTSCTAQLQYRAIAPKEVKVGTDCDAQAMEQKDLIEYEYDVAVDRSGHAIACGFTAILYGGWCWAYLGMPFESQMNEAKKYGRERILSRLKLPEGTPSENCIIRESVREGY